MTDDFYGDIAEKAADGISIETLELSVLMRLNLSLYIKLIGGMYS
ncbi:hypothetical protein Q4567_05350 [Aliiglaciecola sp. 2_MG-2023]|nr:MULTISPECIES: hypothetical protein [unclassified Aliiglaciecola]MDO6710142.1 hypothetical protein [Aliiglaciecola sp. 2_MG-2023]MDO6751290.1 hypothetical protein [Aliiglaciecola sp. 1_MG-2023]